MGQDNVVAHILQSPKSTNAFCSAQCDIHKERSSGTCLNQKGAADLEQHFAGPSQ